MLYNTAAYLVNVTITLLFATPVAGFDIEGGKKVVNRTLTNLISIVLEDQSPDLEGLIRIANNLVNNTNFSENLLEVAQNKTYGWNMLEEIETYLYSFRELLNEAGIEDDHDENIPMLQKTRTLRKLSKSQPVTTPQMQRIKPIEVIPTLREVLRTNSDYKDGRGFKVMQGIQEVITTLDIFIKLASNIHCTKYATLKNFASIMLSSTTLHDALMSAASKKIRANAIIKEIDKYRNAFLPLLSEDQRNDILGEIRGKCESTLKNGESGATSSSRQE